MAVSGSLILSTQDIGMPQCSSWVATRRVSVSVSETVPVGKHF